MYLLVLAKLVDFCKINSNFNMYCELYIVYVRTICKSARGNRPSVYYLNNINNRSIHVVATGWQLA